MKGGDVEDRTTVGRLPWSGRERLGSDFQVLVGVGGLLALLAVAVGVGVFLIVSLKDDATELSHRHVEYTTAVHEAALSAKAMANEQRGFLLSGDPGYIEQLEQDSVDARSAFAVAASLAVTASQREAAAEARAGFERWLRALRADIENYREGSRKSKDEAIEASLGSTRRLRKSYERSLTEAYDLGVRSIDSATASLSSSASRSVTILLIYLAVALLIGVAMAVWVVRAILRPAFVLSRNAIEVLTRGRLLVEGESEGTHRGVSVEVPVEVINALAESALDAQRQLRPGRPVP
jgi:methyl-accepting chemotaxis protein